MAKISQNFLRFSRKTRKWETHFRFNPSFIIRFSIFFCVDDTVPFKDIFVNFVQTYCTYTVNLNFTASSLETVPLCQRLKNSNNKNCNDFPFIQNSFHSKMKNSKCTYLVVRILSRRTREVAQGNCVSFPPAWPVQTVYFVAQLFGVLLRMRGVIYDIPSSL